MIEKRARQLPLGEALVSGLLGGLLAAFASLAVLFIAQSLGLEVAVPMGFGGQVVPVSTVMVVVTTLVPGLAAGVLYWLLARYLERPKPIFIVIAGVFLLVSFGGPLGMPGIASNVRPVLALMHVLSALGITWVILRRA